MKLVVTRTVTHYTDLIWNNRVELNVLLGVAKRAAATVANRNHAFHFDHVHLFNQIFCVAAEWPILPLV
jgi:hypothetical protein